MWNYWGRILNEVKKRERGMVGGKKKVFLMTSRLQNLQKDERREG